MLKPPEQPRLVLEFLQDGMQRVLRLGAPPVVEHGVEFFFGTSVKKGGEVGADAAAGGEDGVLGERVQLLAPGSCAFDDVVWLSEFIDETDAECVVGRKHKAADGEALGVARADLAAQRPKDDGRQRDADLDFGETKFEIAGGTDAVVAEKGDDGSSGGCVSGERRADGNRRAGERFHQRIKFEPETFNADAVEAEQQREIESGGEDAWPTGNDDATDTIGGCAFDGFAQGGNKLRREGVDRRAIEPRFPDGVIVDGCDYAL